MKLFSRLTPFFALLLCLAFFVSSCGLTSSKSTVTNAVPASQTAAETEAADPFDSRTLDSDKADLEAAGYEVGTEDGFVFGMMEPIKDVVTTLIVDTGSEERDSDQYLCILYFPSPESMTKNSSEFNRLITYLAGFMSTLDDTCVVIPTGSRFIIAYNDGAALLPIVTPDVRHKHDFGSPIVVSSEDDPKTVLKRTCTVCGRVELSTENKSK